MQVRAGELINSLHQIQAEGFSGITEFESVASDGVDQAPLPTAIRFFLVFRDGAVTYAGRKVLTPLEFAHWIRYKMQLTHMESTLQIMTTRTKNPDSVRELVEFIIRFGLIKWSDLEALMHREVAIFLEQAQSYTGVLKKTAGNFDLSYGEDHHSLDLRQIQQLVEKRQQIWRALSPNLTLETKPSPGKINLETMPANILPHFNRWITGQFRLSEIAQSCAEDPLNLAQTYISWQKQGWLNFKNLETKPPSNSGQLLAPATSRPIILSVDDSKIVQTMIARAIGDLYDVQLANNAVDALNILHSQKVALLLLDVTMPDIDGLELCRNIRAMPQFKQLPIIMLTAKDGIVDKFKGQFAGSTQYLIKPVDRAKLLPVLEKYIPQTVPQPSTVTAS